MGNPFIYPKTKHKRTQAPPLFGDYKKYKPILQQEFGGQCVYCCGLDNKGYEAFGVDHYRPKKHFPHLATEYLNLFYACNRCNSLKRDFWPTANNKKLGQFVPNPCEYVMFEHLRFKGGAVEPVSPAGKFSVEWLDLNDPKAVDYRDGLIGAIKLVESQLITSTKTLKEIEKKFASVANQLDADLIGREFERAKQNIAELKDILRKLGGSRMM